ncbi:MAG: sugar phosphate isomerase/epimerase family protein [Planctomycetota bacterium]|jgi:sugar phosphate isomerase/epimerase
MAPPIGVNLWTLRETIESDVAGTLKRVADIGFKAVEPVGLLGRAPAEWRSMVEDVGMVMCSSMDPGVEWETFDACIVAYQTMGSELICHGGFTEVVTLDDLKAEAEQINAGIEKLEAVGMGMFMHNHEGEFASRVDGCVGYDVLMELCPKLRAEFDPYWAACAGADYLSVIERYAGRMPIIHLRDGGIEPKFPSAPLGQGRMDIVGCLKRTDPGVLRWIIVELDVVEGDMFDALAQSYNFLTGAGFAEGTK